MSIIELLEKEEMLKAFSLLTELYPKMTMEEYSNQLDIMIPHNYSMVAVFVEDEIVGVSGMWIGHKLWCGKYMELDNVIVTEKWRSSGTGNLMFEFAKKKAKEQSCSSIGLDSYTYNHASHKFFFKEDFVIKGYHFVHIIDQEKMR